MEDTRTYFLFHVVLCLLTWVVDCYGLPSDNLNLRPVIGVLAQHPPDSMLVGLEDHNFTSYIAASYVKHLESAGARVIPILTYREDEYYENLAQSLNGIVFPGGAVSISNSSGYGAAGRKLYDHAVAANERGVYLPIWGTCLGFELLTYLAADDTNWLARCEASNRADPLTLQVGYEVSQVFQEMPEDVKTILTMENVTVNFHHWCLTRQNFSTSGLSELFNLLATSVDDDGLEYISLMEHWTLPIFGSQFHPEKNPFEWSNDDHHDAIPHTPNAILSAQYFVNFFVNQARRNNQTFGSSGEEESALIYNYTPYYTGNTSGFVQSYLFSSDSTLMTNNSSPRTIPDQRITNDIQIHPINTGNNAAAAGDTLVTNPGYYSYQMLEGERSVPPLLASLQYVIP
ncbi:hypothetical protein Pmani_001874 [Petrolisthes manimaculis]|uniref:folate gamma-glutamyl hydrolase n=1 Tax=Petrolisthes manimaculis TaxID=1843537 RepID=A0AAE1URL2_9EUCA|nr:hypothetical protein Pmani_001874 [Petrolisthes manimaculis]